MNTYIKKLLIYSFLKYPNFLKINVNFNDADYWPRENIPIITNLKQKKLFDQSIEKHIINIKKRTILSNKIYCNAI